MQRHMAFHNDIAVHDTLWVPSNQQENTCETQSHWN
jgi:hypothetical protein